MPKPDKKIPALNAVKVRLYRECAVGGSLYRLTYRFKECLVWYR
jgi:hypothetical protein